jgi:mannose-6-phosphate isomerase-like protein (cupin superfamily)
MKPGGIQHIHSHAPEQAYYILEGNGLMTVDSERQTVQAGDCIFFPAFAKHGLENTGKSILRYLSAASPSFTRDECRALWPLPSENEEK